MSSRKNRPNADFEPAVYRKSIAEVFGALDPQAQRELAERIAVLPRHIHALAQKGLIAVTLTPLHPEPTGA